MKKIALTRGFVAVIDDEDLDLISGFKWHAQVIDGVPYAYNRGGPRSAKKTTSMARLVLGLPDGVGRADHINGDSLDNRRSNLRKCTQKQNGANRGKNKNNRSGFKGVTRCVDRGSGRVYFISNICVDGRTVYLGSFGSAEDAAVAYDDAAVKNFGEFAWTNAESRSARSPARLAASTFRTNSSCLA